MRNISGEVAPSETMEGSEAENSDKIVITDSDLVPLEELDTSEEVVGPVLAKVLSAHQHAVYLQFEQEDKTEICVFSPGRMFVNGSENLLKFALSSNITRAIFPEASEFSVLVQRLAQPFRAPFSSPAESGERTDQSEEKEKKKRRNETKEVVRSVGWAASLVMRGDPPELEKINTPGQRFEDHQNSWQRLLVRISSKLLSDLKVEDKAEAENDESEAVEAAVPGEDEVELEKWFLVSLNGVHPVNIPKYYPEITKSSVRGIVKEIHGNVSGIVEVGPEDGGLLRFHRSVVEQKGVCLKLTDNLESILTVGQEVSVDVARNVDSSGSPLFPAHYGDKVASRLSSGSVSDEAEKDPEEGSYGELCHRVRVVELYEDEEGRIASGLGCIQYSQFIKNGMASASMVGEFVNFSREQLYFYGIKLRPGVDLAHLLTPGDEVRCHLRMLDTKQGRAQFVCKIGWLDGNRAGQAKLSAHLNPSSGSLHKWCERKGLEWSQMEAMVHGVAGNKKDLSEDMAVGYIMDLDPAENNETTSKGLIKIEVGPHKGKVVRFNRSKASLFGMKLENADLLYVVRPNDRVFCEVSGIGDYPEGQYMSQKVQFHQLHPEREAGEEAEDPVSGLTLDEKLSLLFWLDCHHNDWSLFSTVLAGTSPTRYYIPFPRDSFPGRVVMFDQPKNSRYAAGCTSGTIILDQGSLNLDMSEVGEGQIGVRDMKEVKVTFHRSSFWIYGRKMAKADLSYVVQPNQKVMVECKRITDRDREQHSALPTDINFRATVIWIGPTRPRNDRDDPNRNDPGIFPWLSKRGLNIGQFTKLVEGKVPAHSLQELDHNGFYLPPVRGEGASMSSMAVMGRVQMEQLPVIRHGPVITHILESAISCNGPSDPRLFTLLENDDMAQAAHHVSEALRYAIQYYKDATAGMRTGFGMGYGAGGPGGPGGKRPYDYANFGGGHSRPPSKYPRY